MITIEYKAKINENDVVEIIRLYSENKSIQEIAKMFNLGGTQVKRIVNRESWKSVEV